MGEVRRDSGPPPSIIKKGQIGENEFEAMRILEGTGIAPKLIAHTDLKDIKVLNKMIWGNHVSAGNAILQMSEAKGSPLDSQTLSQKQKTEQVDSLLLARSELHKRGVAHNDCHSGNVFYDPKSKKTMIVDYGLSQVGPRFALVEALLTNRDSGSKTSFGEGAQESPAYQTFQRNWKSVVSKLNFGPDDSVEIRSREQDLPPAIRNLSDSQAMALIQKLYEGVK